LGALVYGNNKCAVCSKSGEISTIVPRTGHMLVASEYYKMKQLTLFDVCLSNLSLQKIPLTANVCSEKQNLVYDSSETDATLGQS